MQTKILDWMKCQLVLVLIVVLGGFMHGMPVYGTEGGLTEEEVKKKVVEIIEEEKGEVTKYAIMEYDIEKLYPVISLGLFVNDYIAGSNFAQIIKEREEKSKTRNTQWMLSYKNYQREKCYATFISTGNEVEMVARTIEVENDFDMKLYNGKYTEIDLLEVKKITYLHLDLYMFKITYICMNDGKEYVIPFLNQKIAKECDLKNEKIYTLNDFITILYNSYKELGDESNEEEMANVNSFLKKRKKKLGYTAIAQIRKREIINDYVIVIVVIFIAGIAGICLYVIRRRENNQRFTG